MMEWSWEFCTPNVLLATFGLFVLFSTIGTATAPHSAHEGATTAPASESASTAAPSSVKGRTLLASLSNLTFGMYLMHMFFLAPIATWIIAGDVANPSLPVGLAIPVIALLTFVCSAVTTKLISYIPGSKYIVGV